MFIFLNYLLASNIARKLSSGESDYLWWMLKGRSWPECFSLCQIVWSEYYLEALRGKTGIWYRNKSKIWQRLNGNNQLKNCIFIYLSIILWLDPQGWRGFCSSPPGGTVTLQTWEGFRLHSGRRSQTLICFWDSSYLLRKKKKTLQKAFACITICVTFKVFVWRCFWEEVPRFFLREKH